MSTDFSDMGRGTSQNKYIYQFIHNVYAEFILLRKLNLKDERVICQIGHV
jgi:hypothetical protein